jgi:hypothetical protein
MSDCEHGDSSQQVVLSWVEKHIGPVKRVERQGRWRPAWFVDALKDGRTLPLYVRGDRGGGGWPSMPLSFENELFKTFEAVGVRVPHVYGFINEIPAIVMDAAQGRSNLRTADSKADQDAIRSQLVDQLIMIHRIDPELLRAAGAPYLKSASDRALFYYRGGEKIYLSRKRRPAPMMEFVRGRSPPAILDRLELFADDRVTAVDSAVETSGNGLAVFPDPRAAASSNRAQSSRTEFAISVPTIRRSSAYASLESDIKRNYHAISWMYRRCRMRSTIRSQQSRRELCEKLSSLS